MDPLKKWQKTKPTRLAAREWLLLVIYLHHISYSQKGARNIFKRAEVIT